jgi:SPP1 family predicted phage head-tail adaptor
MNAGQLDRRIQVQRAAYTPDGRGGREPTWQDHGGQLHARRRDVSDAEKASAGVLSSTLVARFTVRSSTLTRGLRADDRIVHDGMVWNVTGIKEVPDARRAFVEITAQTDRRPA